MECPTGPERRSWPKQSAEEGMRAPWWWWSQLERKRTGIQHGIEFVYTTLISGTGNTVCDDVGCGYCDQEAVVV